MSDLFLDRQEVERLFSAPSWQRDLFSDFKNLMTSVIRPFPCLFGVNGYRLDQLRYAFMPSLEAGQFAPVLAAYVSMARSFGPNTSLVLFMKPGPEASMEAYRGMFWQFLEDLARIDEMPWPAAIPTRLDEPAWEFCFAGEPLFVVCNTPAHVLRQSRRSTSLMLTFQPRWVLDRVTRTPKTAHAAFSAVRKRLAPYDLVPPSPTLGRYGDAMNCEYAQYFIDDTNVYPSSPREALGRKPLCAQQRQKRDENMELQPPSALRPHPAAAPRTLDHVDLKINRGGADPNDLAGEIERFLPAQGNIEIQCDSPGMEHAWHEHDVDEILVIMRGSIRFYWNDDETVCSEGDVIYLPAGTRHGSVASNEGATYLIAFHKAGA